MTRYFIIIALSLALIGGGAAGVMWWRLDAVIGARDAARSALSVADETIRQSQRAQDEADQARREAGAARAALDDVRQEIKRRPRDVDATTPPTIVDAIGGVIRLREGQPGADLP